MLLELIRVKQQVTLLKHWGNTHTMDAQVWSDCLREKET